MTFCSKVRSPGHLLTCSHFRPAPCILCQSAHVESTTSCPGRSSPAGGRHRPTDHLAPAAEPPAGPGRPIKPKLLSDATIDT
jgi:hypothetical protein